MEETNTRNGDRRRLVLGFDAGCMTCSGLAKSIEEAVGDRLEIRSLNDPIVEHWRKQALGEHAPWAPTLVEVRGGLIKAWTGPRMGANLARRLGLAATWRVAKVLGEMKKDVSLEDSPYSGLSRSQFLKGVGGAVVGISVLSGTSMLSSSAGAWERKALESIGHRDLDGQELGKVARNVAERADITNVMGSSWSRKVRTSRIAKTQADGQDIDVLTNHANPSVRAESDGVSVSEGGVVVKAAKHKLKGNELLALLPTWQTAV